MNKVKVDKLVRKYLQQKGLPLSPALTFEDVTIVDQFSDIPTRSELEHATGTTRMLVVKNIFLNIPVVSANMDTITESRMAIAMARAGGMGFIHQFLSVADRAKEIELVKRAHSGVIEKPLVATPDTTLAAAKSLMAEYKISSLLVVDHSGKLLGILARRDYMFEDNNAKTVGELMKRNSLITASPHTTVARAQKILAEHKIEKLPLVDRKGIVKGLITAQDIAKTQRFPLAARDEKGRLLVGGTVGVSGKVLYDVEALLKAEADIILIDTARGNSRRLIDTVLSIRKNFGSKIPLIAGNIDTPDACLRLINAGVDAVKVGIGGGSACKTRMGPGVGIPQLSAIAECTAIAREYRVPVIADGGIKNSSDFAKALAAGAYAVMLGGLLAGTEETPGKPFYEDGEKWKIFRGSASIEFQMSRIDREDRMDFIRTPEGVPKRVKYRGEVTPVLGELMGHLYSSMSYVGAWTLSEFWERAFFRMQTRSGYEEGRPHDVY